MRKKLEDVRKNISNRKLGKTIPKTRINVNNSPLLSDEERYGNQPSGAAGSPGTIRLKTTWFPKFLIAIFLFFFTFLIYHSPNSLIQSSKPVVQYALTEDLPFAKMQTWYEAHFGGSFVSLGFDRASPEEVEGSLLSVPVSGLDSERINQEGDGITIEVTGSESVYPLEKGTVLFAGNKPDTGRTIILQHDDGRKSTYGNLEEIDVFHYQSISASQSIGTVEPDEVMESSQLYFAIQDGNEYINPIQEVLGDMDED